MLIIQYSPAVGMPVQSKPKQDTLHMPGLPVQVMKYYINTMIAKKKNNNMNGF